MKGKAPRFLRHTHLLDDAVDESQLVLLQVIHLDVRKSVHNARDHAGNSDFRGLDGNGLLVGDEATAQPHDHLVQEADDGRAKQRLQRHARAVGVESAQPDRQGIGACARGVRKGRGE